MNYLGLFLLSLALPLPALALTTSENAFRLEDSGKGNVMLGAERAEIAAGEIFNTVVLLWGNLDIHGEVDEVLVLSGRVVFHPTARLKKTLVVMGGSFESQPGAQVAPESVIYRAPGPLWRILQSMGNLWRDHFSWVAKVFGALLLCLILWVIGFLTFTFVPALRALTEGRLLKEWPQNLLVGCFGSLLAPIGIALLLISVLGIALIPLYLLMLALAGLVTYLAVALWVGHRVLPPKGKQKLNPGGLLLGILFLQLLWAGGFWWSLLLLFALWTLAWGALLRGARQLWR